MLEVKNLTKTFDGFTALSDLSLTVPRGAVYGLVGPNGAGKSTVIRHIMGVYRPDSGSVTLDGIPIYENPDLKSTMVCIPDEIFYEAADTILDLKRLYAGIYPKFDENRFCNLGKVFQLDVRSPFAGSPRVCRSRRPSGWPFPAARRFWCWTSRWTVWTRSCGGRS